jgi:VanZ family protein
MRPLRYGYLWLAGGISLLATVLYFALTPATGRMIIPSDKGAHFLVFTALMLWFGGVFRLRRAPLVALGLLAFGILIELLQGPLSYRSAEVADALFDFGGILIGWALVAAGLGRWTSVIESWLTRIKT